MLVEIGAKTLQVVLDKEDSEELRDFVLHRQVPVQQNDKNLNQPRDGETAEENFAVAPEHGISGYH